MPAGRGRITRLNSLQLGVDASPGVTTGPQPAETGGVGARPAYNQYTQCTADVLVYAVILFTTAPEIGPVVGKIIAQHELASRCGNERMAGARSAKNIAVLTDPAPKLQGRLHINIQ